MYICITHTITNRKLKNNTVMLSKKLHEAMNAQINAELWSAYLYLSMSMDAEAKGLKGVATGSTYSFRRSRTMRGSL